MTRAASERVWRCGRCSGRLGLIDRSGTLLPLGTVASVEATGTVRVRCGDCGAPSAWTPPGRQRTEAS